MKSFAEFASLENHPREDQLSEVAEAPPKPKRGPNPEGLLAEKLAGRDLKTIAKGYLIGHGAAGRDPFKGPIRYPDNLPYDGANPSRPRRGDDYDRYEAENARTRARRDAWKADL